MKRFKYKVSALALMLLSVFVLTPDVFAYDYGMDYSGGTALGASNVQINPTLVNDLTSLIKFGASAKNNVVFSENEEWEEGYISSSTCAKVSYLRVRTNAQVFNAGLGAASRGPFYLISKSPYTAKIQIDDISLDGIDVGTFGGNDLAVAVQHSNGGLHAGYKIYADAECQTAIEDISGLKERDNGKVFVRANIKLFNNGEEFVSNNLYFGITDIDAAQSYKILNENDLLKRSNMYAESAEALQPTDPAILSKNMFNANEHYIYSEYLNGESFNIETSGNDIFVKISNETQREGLDIVFGFAASAGSGIQYYAKQYVVNYVSDENGEISGIKDESIISSTNPSGSVSTPNKSYRFTYWIANVDVTLEDGTTIKAGEKMTPEQVKLVVVDRDITFTAIHETEDGPAVPNTGSSTAEGSLMPITISMIGVALGAMVLGMLPKLFHKRIDFGK